MYAYFIIGFGRCIFNSVGMRYPEWELLIFLFSYFAIRVASLSCYYYAHFFTSRLPYSYEVIDNYTAKSLLNILESLASFFCRFFRDWHFRCHVMLFNTSMRSEFLKTMNFSRNRNALIRYAVPMTCISADWLILETITNGLWKFIAELLRSTNQSNALIRY